MRNLSPDLLGLLVHAFTKNITLKAKLPRGEFEPRSRITFCVCALIAVMPTARHYSLVKICSKNRRNKRIQL